jgi:hypothetical protein
MAILGLQQAEMREVNSSAHAYHPPAFLGITAAATQFLSTIDIHADAKYSLSTLRILVCGRTPDGNTGSIFGE